VHRRDSPRPLRSGPAFAIAAWLALLVWPLAASAACPNEALRSELHSGQLPECRAYELATPSYKEGNVPELVGISTDGQHVIAASLGVLAGSGSDTISQLGTSVAGAVYELSREPSGWTASAVAPLASDYHNPTILYDASSDFESTLWGLAPNTGPARVTSFYLERPRGTFVRIGPATPGLNVENEEYAYIYLGASANLSHILFSISEPRFRWSFDETGGTTSSLYELVGTENSAPSLVGVNDGAGSTSLISKCGIMLGSSALGEGATIRGSMYNAISASGNRVFFTALGCGEQPPVNELFAREETPAGEAKTVAISEPSKRDCSACLTSGGLESAVFQGASRDGAKVFFLTSQELLPGAKGENLYEYDFDRPAGQRVVLASAGVTEPEGARVQGVARISEDGSEVYFVAQGVLTSAHNSFKDEPQSGKDNLYAFNTVTGETAFIAELESSDHNDWAQSDNRPVEASYDGRFLVFLSYADLTHEEVSGNATQAFQYDRETGTLVRASIGKDGYNNDGRTPEYGAQLAHVSASYAGSDAALDEGTTLAPGDGAVFFSSPDALTPQALNDALTNSAHPRPIPNIYEYTHGMIYLLSDGLDTTTVTEEPSVRLLGSSGSGEDLFFTTSDALIGQDTDSQQDIYDAQAMGGFPGPRGAASCPEDGCQSPLSAAPMLAMAGSATQGREAVPLPPVPAPAQVKAKAKVKVKPRTEKRRGKKAKKVVHRNPNHRRASR
jgi:hypothetical protein